MTSPSPTHSDSSGSSKHDSNQDSWEIVEGLRGLPASMQEPDRQEGFLLKRRKWPMKGWHKRYFMLEKGILKYAKRVTDLKKGKLHGCIDVGLSVMSIKKKAMCIDLDTEDNIYHLKVKSLELFEEWVLKLRHHRVFRQNEIAMYPHERHLFHPHASSSPSLNDSLRKRATLTKQTSAHQAKVSSWLHSSGDMDKCCKDLEECESYLLELNLLLKSMEVLHRTYSAPAISALQTSTYDIPKKEKRQRRWRSKNNGKETKATLQVPSCISSQSPRLHASNPNLSTTESNSQEVCPESPDSPTNVSRLQEDFCRLANNIHGTLKSAFSSLVAERDRLRHTIDLQAPQPAQVMGLKTAYTSECPGGPHSLVHQVSNESRASIPESITEFFDAQEYLLSSSSSENEVSDDDSYISDISDSISMDTCSNEGGSERHNSVSSVLTVTRRRSTLPSPSPTCSVSLWNILKNNIGKDLSKVAMPVQLNEPINTLQRLCEELEYSELLDAANQTHDPYQRMVYVATFAISAYASTYHRAGSKPFNPVLGETYECDRPDKGFRFISEQAKSWSSTVNEIEGVVTDSNGKVVHSIFGKWHESVFQGDPPSATCIWRANPMPVDQEQYYGFTQFAVELNEMDSTLRPMLPPTDTRLRPDQRLLEEGNIEGAEEQKQRIEQLQRERRKVLQDNNMTHQPRFFKKSNNDTWVSNNTYWELRRDPGFSKMDFPVLW